MRRILCIWLPNWPIQRLVVAHSGLRRQPVVLYRNHAQRGWLVSAASPAAQLRGVRIDMPLAEAKSLAEAAHGRDDHGCYLYEHDLSADHSQLEQLAVECYQFSPIVGLESGRQPSGLLLEVTGLAHLFGGESNLQMQVEQYFHQLGYTVATAIAPTIGVAWGLAHHPPATAAAERASQITSQKTASSRWHPRRTSAKNVARLQQQVQAGSAAIDHPDADPPREQAPLDRTVESPDQSLARFHQLPIEALRLKPDTCDTLHQLGITRIQQVLQLPRAGLLSRFGDEITWRLDQAAGTIDEVITALQQPADFSAEQFLEYPVSDRQTIQVILSRLANELCGQLRCQQRGGLVWHCQLRSRSGRSIDFPIKLFQPTATLQHLMPLIEMQLENVFSENRRWGAGKKSAGCKLASEIQEIAISVNSCALLAERQRQLFDENPRLDHQALSLLINRLSSRLGDESVVTPRLPRPGSARGSGAQAESACLFQTLVGSPAAPADTTRDTTRAGTIKSNRSPSSQRRRPPGTAISPLGRPLVLHPQPIEVAAVSLSGQQHRASHLPARFVYGGQPLRVLRRWGPERIETSWWRGPTVRRDYWRIETQAGRWLWIFQDLRDRKWYLHGEF